MTDDVKDKVIERLIADLEQRESTIEILRNEVLRLNRSLEEDVVFP